MTTASKITMIRVALIPIFFVLMLVPFPGHMWVSLAVFIVASLTDTLDGHIARKHNQVSDFGKFIDPLADKLLVFAAVLIFVAWDQIPSWAAMIIIAREFAVTGLRLIAVENGIGAVVLESHKNWIDRDPIKSLELSAKWLNRQD